MEVSQLTNRPLVKDLYHRAPYLLIDNVLSCDEKNVVATKSLEENEFFFQGHFPNAPVLPGALMQEMTTQTAGVLIARFHNPLGEQYDTENFDPKRPALGVLSRVKDAKYKSFARPGDFITVKASLIEKIEGLFEFKGQVYKGDGDDKKLIMTNRFCLTNVPSSFLLGD